MDKQPLYSIDTLFQHKLEELPVDASQQHEQWLSLSKAMHKPTSFGAQLRKPWAKGLYMTIVALVPFGIFYLSNQSQTSDSPATNYTPGSVTKSLKHLTKTESSTQTNNVHSNKQNVLQQETRAGQPSIQPAIILNESKKQVVANEQPAKSKDSVRTAPAKPEKPVVKKADSTYIYWQ